MSTTYLLAPSARVGGVRYERGAELPEHETTTRLLAGGRATHDILDLVGPQPEPPIVNGDPKSAERSVTPRSDEILVGDGNGVHAEVEASAVRTAGEKTVTSSNDGPTVTENEQAKPAARTGTARK